MTSRHALQREVDAGRLGLSGVTLASARTSNTFSMMGMDTMQVEVNLSARTAATTVTAYLEVTNDESTWYRTQTVSWSSGTGTLTDQIWSKAVSAADTFTFKAEGLDYDRGRLVFDGASGGTGDIISVRIRFKSAS